MKVTKDKLKGRQPREEGQLQKVSAEQREDAATVLKNNKKMKKVENIFQLPGKDIF